MTPEQIGLVQSSWRQVLGIKEQAAALFYKRLFELDPALQKLFKGDMTEQGTKLMNMISTAVNGLTRLESIVPAVQELGRRHVRYSVNESDYATVGAALLWTLERGLGAAFTPAVKQAWTETYGVLANTMQQAARYAA